MNAVTVIVFNLMIYSGQMPLLGDGSAIIAKNIATQQACDQLGQKLTRTAYSGLEYTCIPTTIVVPQQLPQVKPR